MLKIILILLFLLFTALDIIIVCGNSLKKLLHSNKKHTSQIDNSEIKY